MAGGISVDPEVVRGVAQQCSSIQSELSDTSNRLSSQLSTLQSALTGAAAQHFEQQFQAWQKHVAELSQTLGSTSHSLNQIADEADAQISALNSLAGLQG